ncbi:MAG: alpha/beta fold hydrolase [Fimbriimonadales bacterium]|nr:alpha/beta fold hydrolase [Fimbriimonadales bacterium]
MLIGICIAVGVYLSILIVVAWSATHPPRSPLFLSPTALGVDAEEVEFDSEGIPLKGWWTAPESPSAVAVLLHGYVMSRAENAALAVQLHRNGIASLLFDFRAHGKSGGKLTGIGWFESADVIAACRFARERYPNLPVLLIGSSMGSAAAVFAVAEAPDCADGLVLDSSYSSLASATLGWWNFIGGKAAVAMLAPVVLVSWPIVGFNPFKVSVSRALATVKKPVMIIHGEEDDLVLPDHAKRNFAAANEPKELVMIPGASHSEARWLDPSEYERRIVRFVESLSVSGSSMRGSETS